MSLRSSRQRNASIDRGSIASSADHNHHPPQTAGGQNAVGIANGNGHGHGHGHGHSHGSSPAGVASSIARLQQQQQPASRWPPSPTSTFSHVGLDADAASSLTTSNLSSSLTHRGPARSFVTMPSAVLAGTSQYASSGVRDTTAELAAFTFSKLAHVGGSGTGSGTSTSREPARHSVAAPEQVYSPLDMDDDEDEDGEDDDDRPHVQRWDDAPRSYPPETIPELSEPVSPDEHATAPPALDGIGPRSAASSAGGDRSVLSSMLRKLSSYGPNSKPRKQDEAAEDGHEQARPAPEIHVEDEDGNENDNPTEQTPLLRVDNTAHGKPPALAQDLEDPMLGDVENQKPRSRNENTLKKVLHAAQARTSHTLAVLSDPKQWDRRAVWRAGIVKPVSLLPCVFLGVLLNVLDALSYGMILFPLGEPIFAKTGPDGISMFYVSCIVSQLVYSCGGSIFKGAVGSEMIEVVPFFHKMTYTILARTGTARPEVVFATVITSYAMSSIITGIVFFGLGAFKLGSLVSFFPRHILVGCIGGVGFFLFVTGIEVSARLDGNLEYNLETVRALFAKDTIGLWAAPLALSIVLRIATRFSSSPYIVPAFFIAVIVVFYIVVVAVTAFNVPLAREHGWIFPAVEAGVPFYHFYSYYDFAAVDWKALGATIPSMFALTFFGVLHVPINIPALGIAANEDDLNLNRELVAHGFSNALSGLVGSIQNYLVYVNSAMFINNGGNSRLAGLFLAAATFGVWVAGPGMIGFVPVMVVGALIFYLGIDLLQEAVVDTWGKMSVLEYLTVVVIVLVMGIHDFVVGILVGVVLACLNFVVHSSRKSAIRATYSGEIVESTVRRHPIQRHFLHEVGNQIYVFKLAGFLFFGSIVRVEKESRALIEEEAFRRDPIKFLVFDLDHVDGLDYTAAEAFGRMERILARRRVRMVLSGVAPSSDVGKALKNAGVWADDGPVIFFETLNTALEYCENEQLTALYRKRDALDASDKESPPAAPQAVPGQSLDEPGHGAGHGSGNGPASRDHRHSIAASPRQRFLDEAASTTLTEHTHSLAPRKYASMKQPLPLILQTFQNLTPFNEDFWFKAVPYFERKEFARGVVLFSPGQEADAFYLLEKGMLRATYRLPMGTYHESIVAGTVCGELPFFSETARTATVFAELDTVSWRLTSSAWRDMQAQWPEGARELLRIGMKLTKERVDAVVAYVLTTAG